MNDLVLDRLKEIKQLQNNIEINELQSWTKYLRQTLVFM